MCQAGRKLERKEVDMWGRRREKRKEGIENPNFFLIKEKREII